MCADLAVIASDRDRPSARSGRDGPHAYDDLEPDLSYLARAGSADPHREACRRRVICAFLPLVHNLSQRYRGRVHSAEDLEQAGVLGLIKAIDRYDPDAATGGPLGYLIPSVRGEMLRYLRDHSWALRVPRDLKELSGRLDRASTALHQRLGRAPRPGELAAEIGADVEDVVDALTAQQSHHAASLDAPPGPDGEAPLGELLGVEDDDLAVAEIRHELRARIGELPERERTILLMRFYGNNTQSEIAAAVGISQMHVSRLLSRTIAMLRTALSG